MDFFDLVPDNFFSLLASKNKRIYLASILQVFKTYETGTILGIDKKIVVDDLVYFLDTNKNYLYDVEDEEDEEADPKSQRELANYILRRMEETGWIYVDVTNDYIEVLNFSDDAIIICDALLKAYPQFEYSEDEWPEDFINPSEYQGYIYNIYTLLNNLNLVDNPNYALTFDLIYSDTKALIRSLRKLDARMKEYLKTVIDNSEIKDLMEKLITYKNEVYDKSYAKLKISDNIDRYRLKIVTQLEDMQNTPAIVEDISRNYLAQSKSLDDATNKAIKRIDEVIDAFNAIEEFIAEIDIKNRDYINSTIGKIKFLLSEDDNVIGKLNTILKYVADENRKGHVEKALNLISKLFYLPERKVLDNEKSIYIPRGPYTRNYNQTLDDMGMDFDLPDDFYNIFKNSYNEDEIKKFLDMYMINGEFRASRIIEFECDNDFFLMIIYCVIYGVEHGYEINIIDNYIETKTFRIKDFEILAK